MKQKKIYRIPEYKKNKITKKNRRIYRKTKNTKTTNNTNTTSTNSIITNTSKIAKCAPFIKPTNLSKGTKITNSNVNIIESATDESCFTIEALRKIANKWNDNNPNMKIIFDVNTNGKVLWNNINNMMSNKCKTEICWMKQDFIKDSSLARELLKNFKPMMPKKWETNPIEWLNTIDIRYVMNQYEIKYPEFEFVGPVPMDFDTKLGFGQCVVDELCKVKLNNLIAKGDTKLGVIFNLDKHNQSGSHWVAMYCDVKDGYIGYWDSYGMKPSPEIVVLMDRLKEQGKELKHNLEIKINKNRHQYKNSECGVYCIYFIISLLDGKSFEDVVNNIVSDDNMNEKRKVFFNKDF